MTPVKSLLLISALALSACAAPPLPTLGPDGRPLPQVYTIGSNDTEQVQITMLDAVNSLRSAAGAGPLRYDASLNAAAATHSRDMSIQNRPWHFGSDGSSPLDRVRRAGYGGMMLGENISETYETELETLAAWIDDSQTRDVLLDPKATDMGFAWFQEDNGKIWWTLMTGR
ncbi:CAP domain-containing protein [Profundibacterium mesophilum]|nr:CAP domain-containing protein [Profundibacterium mesophilum]